MKLKKEKVLIFHNLPSILIANGKYYATQLHKGEWLVGNELPLDSIRDGKIIEEIEI